MSVPYMKKINELTDRLALPFTKHRSYGPGGPVWAHRDASFRSNYGGIA
jgi:hypothetical protein